MRWNMLHPKAPPREPYVTRCLKDAAGPVIAATDYVKLYANQIRPFVPGRFHALGTDGYGRSDSREKLRAFFEVDRRFRLSSLPFPLWSTRAGLNPVWSARPSLSLASTLTNPIRRKPEWRAAVHP